MKHKTHLVIVGKAVADIYKELMKSKMFDKKMMNIVIDSDVNMCRDLQCGEPMELHTFICRICFKVEGKCEGEYSLSIEGVEL